MRCAGTTPPTATLPHRLWAALPIALALLGSMDPANAAPRRVTVMLDRAQIMRYPPDTETVVVGNPIIADVTMLRNTGQVILTGRGYGDTNLIFLDARGKLLGENDLEVRQPGGTVVIQRGADRETYSCETRCQPTVTLGDRHEYFREAIKDVNLRNGLASGAAADAPKSPGQ